MSQPYGTHDNINHFLMDQSALCEFIGQYYIRRLCFHHVYQGTNFRLDRPAAHVDFIIVFLPP